MLNNNEMEGYLMNQSRFLLPSKALFPLSGTVWYGTYASEQYP